MALETAPAIAEEPAAWGRLVARGREAAHRVDDGKWQLGDLALEVEPVGRPGTNTGALGRLREYADEIGVEYESLKRYRTVAAAWPARTRVRAVSWSVHRVLAREPDLVALLADLTDRGIRTVRAVERELSETRRSQRAETEATFRRFRAEIAAKGIGFSDAAVRRGERTRRDDAEFADAIRVAWQAIRHATVIAHDSPRAGSERPNLVARVQAALDQLDAEVRAVEQPSNGR